MTATVTATDFLNCGVAGQRIAIPAGLVERVLPASRVRASTAPRCVCEIPDPGGPILVRSPAAMIGVQRPEPRLRQQVIVLGGESRSGLLVDQLRGKADIGEGDIFTADPSLPVELRDHFTGLFWDGEAWAFVWKCDEAVEHPGVAAELPEELRSASLGLTNRLLTTPLMSFRSGRPLVAGLPMSWVAAIDELPSLTPVPGQPPHHLGLAKWRDRPIRVFDLRALLGVESPADDAPGAMAVLRGFGEGFLGVAIREAGGLLRLPVAHAECRRELPVDLGVVKLAVELADRTLVIPTPFQF